MSIWGTRRKTGRLEHRPWRDPRVMLGMLLVLGSAAAGALLLTDRDGDRAYWAIARDVTAGAAVEQEDLVSVRAGVSEAAAEHLLRVDEELPARMESLSWGGDLGAGRLVQRSDLVRATRTVTAELPLVVAPGAAPDDLARGDTVDVWSGPGPGDEAAGDRADKVLADVRVLAVGRSAQGRGRTVVVDVGRRDPAPRVVARVATSHVTIVRLP